MSTGRIPGGAWTQASLIIENIFLGAAGLALIVSLVHVLLHPDRF